MSTESVNNVGLTVEMFDAGLERIAPNHHPTQYLVDYVGHPADTFIDAAVSRGRSTVSGLVVERGDRSVANLVRTVQTALRFVTSLLLMIALGVCGAIAVFLTMTAVTRETRDLGVMKTMGYSTRSLRRQLAARFFLVSPVSAPSLVKESRLPPGRRP